MTHLLYLDLAASRFHRDRKTDEEPRVVRVAWWRSDEPDPVCRLIEPVAGMTIATETTPYHGLRLADLERDGVHPADVITELEGAVPGASAIVAFNSEFHWRQLYRLMNLQGAVPPRTAVCAMKLAEPICNLPARNRPGTKSPSLREACEFFSVEPPLTAGDPVDVAFSTLRAVRGVYEACTAGAES